MTRLLTFPGNLAVLLMANAAKALAYVHSLGRLMWPQISRPFFCFVALHSPSQELSTSNQVSISELPKERATNRAVNTPEILDMILARIPPVAAIGSQRVSRAFYRAVVNNSKVEKKVLQYVCSERTPKVLWTWDGWLSQGGLESLWIDPADAIDSGSSGLVPWSDIIGHDYGLEHREPAVSMRREYYVTVGHAFDSAFIDICTICENGLYDITTDSWQKIFEPVQECNKSSCYVYLQYLASDRDCEMDEHDIPNMQDSTAWHQVRVLAEMDPNLRDLWPASLGFHLGPGIDFLDALRFGEYDASRGTMTARQKRCLHDQETAFLGEPIYEWTLNSIV